MTRGIRGATTVAKNEEEGILTYTEDLLKEMVQKNDIEPTDVSHVFISVTKDLNATFPAKALRRLGDAWKYVPIMCMQEIDVPGSLKKCIRIMMVAKTDQTQENIQHIFHREAKQLRPDLFKRE